MLKQIELWKNNELFANIPVNDGHKAIFTVTAVPMNVKMKMIDWMYGRSVIQEFNEWKWHWKGN